MSTKKLIQEISIMTHKGIYPSLNILLEKDEGDETPDEMGDEVLDQKEESEEEEGTESKESGESETPDEPETPEESEDEISSNTDSDSSVDKLELDRIATEVGAIKAVINSRAQPTSIEKDVSESFRKNYLNLKKFTLLQEDSSNIVSDLQDVLSQFEKNNGFGLGDIKDEMLAGEEVDLNSMLDQAKEKISKPFDVPLAILKDKLEVIRRKAEPKKIEELQAKFTEMFSEYCRQNNIDLTIPEQYKKLKPTNYDVAQGAVKSG